MNKEMNSRYNLGHRPLGEEIASDLKKYFRESRGFQRFLKSKNKSRKNAWIQKGDVHGELLIWLYHHENNLQLSNRFTLEDCLPMLSGILSNPRSVDRRKGIKVVN